MKLLIVAGPHEADQIRRAAVAGGAEAVAVEASDSLPAWIAASRPDLIVLGAGALHADGATALARVRDVPGGDVPVVFVCDPADEAKLAGVGDGVFARPFGPEAVVRRAAELVGAPLPAGADFAAAGSSARRRAGSGSGDRAAAALPPTPASGELPVLRPLARDAQRGTGETVVKAPWLRKFAASIDDALDAEMEDALASLAPGLGVSQTPTRTVPPEIIATIVGVSAHAPVSDAAASSASRRAADAWLEGDLAAVDMPTLLGRALLDGLTGRLRVRNEAIEKSVFFEAGRPVLAVSSLAADRMVQMLVRHGRLTTEQAMRAMAVATETGRRMGAVLIDLGLMKSSELLPAVRQHYEELITSIFAWESGSYRVEVGEVADPRRVRLLRHPVALISEGLRRCHSLARLRSSLARQRGDGAAADASVLVFKLETRADASDALLELSSGDPAVQRLPVLFDGVRMLREVVRVSGLPEVTVLQIAIALRALELLSRVEVVAGARAEPVAARDREIDRGRIVTRHALAREGDYFQVLGLERDASNDEVRAAFEFLSREVADETVGAELAHEHRDALSEIRLVLDDALQVLADPQLRPAYVANLPATGNDGDGWVDARSERVALATSDQRVG